MNNRTKTKDIIRSLKTCGDESGWCENCEYYEHSSNYDCIKRLICDAGERLEELNDHVADADKMAQGDAERAIMKRAIDTYGERAQCDVAIEEMAELTKALLKTRRMSDNDHAAQQRAISNVIEEIADVEIMISQLKIIYGAPYVDVIREQKLVRLENRMEGKP